MELLRGLTLSGDDEWLFRFWCAKEASAKALGKGLLGSPKNLTVREVAQGTGTLTVEMSEKMASHLPGKNGRQLSAKTFREGDLIVAISTYQER
jgi:phosphopantetheinyl transferase